MKLYIITMAVICFTTNANVELLKEINRYNSFNSLEIPFNINRECIRAIYLNDKLYHSDKELFRMALKDGELNTNLPEPLPDARPDLSICGNLRFNGSLPRQGISLIDTLLPYNLSINVVGSGDCKDVANPDISKILQKASKSGASGNIAILEDIIYTSTYDGYNLIPKDAHIKMAYSMLESSRIPKTWVHILNELDCIAVPDEYIKKAYEKSGVTKPVFTLPLGIYIQDFLDMPAKTTMDKPFTFGCIALGTRRKNLDTLVKAFKIAFNNNKDFQLIIKSKQTTEFNHKKLEECIRSNQCTNITLLKESCDWDSYIKLMQSFDCYVYISKGEGFSVTPREALAAGIPCILSNNTAQKTICKTGLVCSVESKIKETAYYGCFKPKHSAEYGFQFNCKAEDVALAMQDVYNNYSHWLEQAAIAKEWTRQYLCQNLSSVYINVIKPKVVILGNEDKVTADYLMTTDNQLFKKYIQIVQSN